MKISKADKEKYYEHFKMLNEDTQLKTNSHNMEECIANIEKKAKSNTGAKRQSVQFNNYSALSRVSLFVPEIVARAANNTLSEPATKQETAINA